MGWWRANRRQVLGTIGSVGLVGCAGRTDGDGNEDEGEDDEDIDRAIDTQGSPNGIELPPEFEEIYSESRGDDVTIREYVIEDRPLDEAIDRFHDAVAQADWRYIGFLTAHEFEGVGWRRDDRFVLAVFDDAPERPVAVVDGPVSNVERPVFDDEFPSISVDRREVYVTAGHDGTVPRVVVTAYVAIVNTVDPRLDISYAGTFSVGETVVDIDAVAERIDHERAVVSATILVDPDVESVAVSLADAETSITDSISVDATLPSSITTDGTPAGTGPIGTLEFGPIVELDRIPLEEPMTDRSGTVDRIVGNDFGAFALTEWDGPDGDHETTTIHHTDLTSGGEKWMVENARATDLCLTEDGDTLVYGSSSPDSVTAVDAETGSTVWERALPGGDNGGDDPEPIWVVSADDHVFTTSQFRDDPLVCLDGEDGTILWTAESRHQVFVADGGLFTQTDSDTDDGTYDRSGTVALYDVESGTRQWERDIVGGYPRPVGLTEEYCYVLETQPYWSLDEPTKTFDLFALDRADGSTVNRIAVTGTEFNPVETWRQPTSFFLIDDHRDRIVVSNDVWETDGIAWEYLTAEYPLDLSERVDSRFTTGQTGPIGAGTRTYSVQGDELVPLLLSAPDHFDVGLDEGLTEIFTPDPVSLPGEPRPNAVTYAAGALWVGVDETLYAYGGSVDAADFADPGFTPPLTRYGSR